MGNSPTSGLTVGGSLANSGGSTADDTNAKALADLQDVLDSLMENKPTKEQFTDPDYGFDASSFTKAQSAWATGYYKVQAGIKNLTLAQMGLHNLPDGTVIASGDLSPEQQAQVDQANKTAYTDILNKFGLDQFNAYGQATDRANKNAQQDFSNRMDQWDRALGLDKFGFDQASKKLDRWLSLQDQATKDASLEQDAQKMAVSYGTTDGKTDFTGSDLGGGVAAMANMAGIPGNEPVIRYPGSQTLDPLGTIDQRAKQYGGGGQAPTLDLPAPLATAGNMPGAPSFSNGPAAPALQLPPQLNLGAPAPGLTPWSPALTNNANPLAGV